MNRAGAIAIWAMAVWVMLTATTMAQPRPPGPQTSAAKVRTGAEVLVGQGLAALAGKRVGLITNQTGTVGNEHLADVLARSKTVTLAAIFAPEHGFRGEAEAGKSVKDGVDRKTGVRVFSIYGATRKPTPAMLRGIDVLVFDIQDIGVRFYTYISTMALAMQAAAEAGIPFLVLDRPNPLGGDYVAGFTMEPAHRSFVGQFAVPMVHGMTVGELARAIKGLRLMGDLSRLELDVVKMEGWKRSMRWPETGLAWQRTSPNIPTFETALVYAGMGLFEAANASEGVGTTTPFLLAGTTWSDGSRIALTLNDLGLPGVRFAPVEFTPRSIPGMVSKPRLDGKQLSGIKIEVTDHVRYRPVETGLAVLGAFAQAARSIGQAQFIGKQDWLAKLAGTRRLGELVESAATYRDIAKQWERDVSAFRAARAPFLLYD